MNKIKIIELLNMISRGEEVPKKIKYKDIIFDYKKEKGDYESEYGQFFLDWVELNEYGLHDEVEIIEEDKKDEEIELYFNGKKVDITDIFEPLKQGEYIYKENDKWYAHRLKNVTFEVEEDKKIENIKVKSTFTRNQKQIARKINEIIDYINKGDEYGNIFEKR